jgi:hypothetical protein
MYERELCDLWRTMYERELCDLWRISRTALDNPSRFDRLQYVSREYRKVHPEVNAKRLWLDITELFRGYGA